MIIQVQYIFVGELKTNLITKFDKSFTVARVPETLPPIDLGNITKIETGNGLGLSFDTRFVESTPSVIVERYSMWPQTLLLTSFFSLSLTGNSNVSIVIDTRRVLNSSIPLSFINCTELKATMVFDNITIAVEADSNSTGECSLLRLDIPMDKVMKGVGLNGISQMISIPFKYKSLVPSPQQSSNQSTVTPTSSVVPPPSPIKSYYHSWVSSSHALMKWSWITMIIALILNFIMVRNY